MGVIKNKFLNENEIQLLPLCNTKFLTLCWCAKEAIYKWYGKGKVDFKNNILIDDLFYQEKAGLIKAHFEKEERTDLQIEFKFFENLCLAWV